MNSQQQPRNSIRRAAEIHLVIAIVEMEKMNTKQRIAELEKELAELKAVETSPDLVRIGGKPQKIVGRRSIVGKQIMYRSQTGWKNKTPFVIPVIEVEAK